MSGASGALAIGKHAGAWRYHGRREPIGELTPLRRTSLGSVPGRRM